MVDSRARIIILKIAAVLLLVILGAKLVQLQLIEGEEYYEVSQNRMSASYVEEAPRGEIYDRYGNPLVTNEVVYSLQLTKGSGDDAEFNKMLVDLVNILERAGIAHTDSLPVSDYQYVYEFEDENEDGSVDDERAAWFENNSELATSSTSAEEVIARLAEKYNVDPGYDATAVRWITGIRYEADMRGYSWTSPFTIAEDVGVEVVSQIKERQAEFPNVIVSNTYKRKYEQDGLAMHLLGRVGKMNESEYEIFKDQGYSYNDIVGKQGLEKYAESYLRGEDGTVGASADIGDGEVSVVENKAPVPGNYIITTIDSHLQKAAEQALEKNIQEIAAAGAGQEKKGGDAAAGAAVVIDIKNGDALALASYPSYTMEEFNENYSALANNEDKPLWNRAVSGTYTPGSTYKPLVAIAALETGAITPTEIIEDKGVYTEYEGYQPRCWIWSEYQTTHGRINVSKAIEVSCNYFFYEVGRRTGIDVLDQYSAMFGLGEYTGIELPEEVTGQVASPEYKAKVATTVTESSWFGGDTLQAAIGQSYHSFTPVQLANYAATIANGGTRYKVNLIKSVHSSVDGSVVKEFEPQIEEKVNMSEETIEAVKSGMRRVVDEGGSASSIFADYPVAIGGKTGTAQVGSKVSNNAVFIAFAPFDDPEIAVAVVIEHGYSGVNAAAAARDIFDAYFGIGNEATPEPSAEVTASPAADEDQNRE